MEKNVCVASLVTAVNKECPKLASLNVIERYSVWDGLLVTSQVIF